MKISSCSTQDSESSGPESSAQPLNQNMAGMLIAGGPWTYVFIVIAGALLLLAGGIKKINGNGRPAFAAGRKMRKGSKGAK